MSYMTTYSGRHFGHPWKNQRRLAVQLNALMASGITHGCPRRRVLHPSLEQPQVLPENRDATGIMSILIENLERLSIGFSCRQRFGD
jgi:hypothetical protein